MRNTLFPKSTRVSLIALSEVETVGQNLHRPECVLCDRQGRLHVSNWSGGVTTIEADGTCRDLIARDAPVPLQPNGIALLPGGAFLLANLNDAGGVWRLDPDGTLTPYLLEVEGELLPAVNFVLCDSPDTAWITVSTRRSPRALAYRGDVADGFIVRITPDGAWIAADGLGYTNECQLHPSGNWLYANETFARRLSRFPLDASGRLGARETVHEFGEGVFPDGLCFDVEGAAWITSIVSNRVIRLTEAGEEQLIIDDSDDAHLAWVEAAFQRGEMGRDHLDRAASIQLNNVSSLAFGGPDRRTAYMGCLLDNRIYAFRSPIAGVVPRHWSWS